LLLFFVVILFAAIAAPALVQQAMQGILRIPYRITVLPDIALQALPAYETFNIYLARPV
jgi:hypothetical protein